MNLSIDKLNTTNKINYQKKLDTIISQLQKSGEVPTLLLHSCCAPCSSYVLEYLSNFFKITVFYYNPNIFPEDEYNKRVIEQQKFINRLSPTHPITFLEGKYEPKRFLEVCKGLEHLPEGGERCFECFKLRLEQSIIIANDLNFDFFTTTLSISPHKNSQVLNQIGEALAEKYNIKHLPSDFKKKSGYKRSIELSKEFELYRQDYCGCAFSKQEHQTRIAQMNTSIDIT